MINQIWGPAIVKAVSKHFNDNSNTYMYLKGRKDKRNENSEWFELRFIGPKFIELSKDVWDITLTAAIIIQTSTQDVNGVNKPFRNSELANEIASLFTCIVVPDLCVLNLEGYVDIGPSQEIKGQPHERVSLVGTYKTTIIT